MTLVSELIQRAYRETNIIPLGGTPSAAQTAEALPFYNSLLLSTVGNEASDGLVDLNIDGEFSQEESIAYSVPDNTRLLFNLSAAMTVQLDPFPQDGQRFAVVDVAGNFATYNLTVDGNGRNIEGSVDILITDSGAVGQWMYRADKGNWVPITNLTAVETHPFPEEFDSYFVTRLALRINPRYGTTLPQETIDELRRVTRQLRSRYSLKRSVGPEYPPLDNDYLTWGYFGGSDGFDTGRYRPWR